MESIGTMDRSGKDVPDQGTVFCVHICSEHLYSVPFFFRDVQEITLQIIEFSAGEDIDRFLSGMIKDRENILGLLTLVYESIGLIDDDHLWKRKSVHLYVLIEDRSHRSR